MFDADYGNEVTFGQDSATAKLLIPLAAASCPIQDGLPAPTACLSHRNLTSEESNTANDRRLIRQG